MVTVDPNIGEYDKQMHFRDGYAMLYSPPEDTILYDKSKLRLSILASISSDELKALIENLQQVVDMGILDG